jgi:predicted nucleic acid-binding protein
VRAVLDRDPNVLISGVLSSSGSPTHVLRAWNGGEFDLIASRALTAERARALAYPKLRGHISSDDAQALTRWIERSATFVADPPWPPPVRSADPVDDYRIALAAAERAILVSGGSGGVPVSADGRSVDLVFDVRDVGRVHGPDLRQLERPGFEALE